MDLVDFRSSIKQNICKAQPQNASVQLCEVMTISVL